MVISARNQFKGKIVSIQLGIVNAMVEIDIGAGNIVTATVSIGSVKDLKLEVGKEAYAIVKATSVMIGIE